MKKLIVFLFTPLILASTVFSYPQSNKIPYPDLSKSEKENKDIDKAIEDFLFSLPIEQRISQLFLVNIDGNQKYSPVEDSKSIDDFTVNKKVPLVPGGAILFYFNIAETAEETIDYISSIAEYCDQENILRPYIAVDQEGGYVARLRYMTSKLPSNKIAAQRLNLNEANKLYSHQAKQMRALGIDLNIAPVCEILTEQNKDFLMTRSYGDILKSISYSVAAINAYQTNGVGTVLKHFPGNTNTDPHTGLPEINVSEIELNNEILLPFFFLMSASPSAVLMSHARINFLDPQTPACLSQQWVTKKLKNQLGFQGLVFSDDIFMGALSDNGFPPEKAAIQAINAGVHVILLSEKKFADVAQVLLKECTVNKDFEKKVTEAEKKVIAFKIKCGILKLEKKSNGSYAVVKVSDLEQNGTKEKRVEIFYSEKESGQDFYDNHILR